MSDLYWLTDEQIARLQPYFPKIHGKPRVDHRWALSGIVFVYGNGLRWCDAPTDSGPRRCTTGGRIGCRRHQRSEDLHDRRDLLKAHRTASILRVKKGVSAA
jgi:transposase